MANDENAGRMAAARGYAERKFAALSQALGYASPGRFAGELIIIALVMAPAAAWAIFQYAQFDFLRLCRGFDLWFDSDPARTVSNLESRWAPFHDRSIVHPLYPLLIATPFNAIHQLFPLRMSELTALYVGVQSALLSASVYIAGRTFGFARLDALLGVVLFYSTASAIYWIGFPETFAFSAITALAAIAWAVGPRAIRNNATGIAQNMMSGAILVVNWPLGVAASLLSEWPKLSWRQAYVHTRSALALMAALTLIQYVVFPHSGPFLAVWTEVQLGVATPEAAQRSLLQLSGEFFSQTLFAPAAAVVEGAREIPGWGVLIMSGQHQLAPLTLLSGAALGCWIALWGLGAFAALRGGANRKAFFFVLGTLGFFYLFHMVFSGETFLFSLHFAPLLGFVALWGALARYKLIVRGLCVALIALSFAHNYPSFQADVAVHNAIDASWLERDFPATLGAAQTDCR